MFIIEFCIFDLMYLCPLWEKRLLLMQRPDRSDVTCQLVFDLTQLSVISLSVWFCCFLFYPPRQVLSGSQKVSAWSTAVQIYRRYGITKVNLNAMLCYAMPYGNWVGVLRALSPCASCCPWLTTSEYDTESATPERVHSAALWNYIVVVAFARRMHTLYRQQHFDGIECKIKLRVRAPCRMYPKYRLRSDHLHFFLLTYFVLLVMSSSEQSRNLSWSIALVCYYLFYFFGGWAEGGRGVAWGSTCLFPGGNAHWVAIAIGMFDFTKCPNKV